MSCLNDQFLLRYLSSIMINFLFRSVSSFKGSTWPRGQLECMCWLDEPGYLIRVVEGCSHGIDVFAGVPHRLDGDEFCELHLLSFIFIFFF